MLKNYLKTALRNFQRNKSTTIINIAGLVIAFTSFIFIILFVLDELSYDKFHSNKDQIYRVRQKVDMLGFSPSTSWLLANVLIEKFPEVKSAVRIQEMEEPIYFKMNNQLIKEEKYLFTDNSIFRIFSFNLKYGDTNLALTIPNSIVISKKIAEKYFGEKNPTGEILHTNIRAKWYNLQVTGVLEEIPSNSDFNTDFMFSSSILYEIRNNPARNALIRHPMETWSYISSYTYILLNKNCNIPYFEAKLDKYFQNNLPDSYIKELKLEQLNDIHLYKFTDAGILKPGSIIYVYFFSAIGILILLIAGINFIILSTANFSVRAKEVGMRKVIGAQRIDLIKQFLSESVLLTSLALPVALFAVKLLIPWVNIMLNKHFDANYFQLWQFILILLCTTLLVGLSSGSYVAFYLSSLPPVTILKNKTAVGNTRSSIRKILIVAQFTIFAALLVCSIVISKQMQYFQESNLGFNKELLIAVDMGKVNFEKHFNAFKQDVLQNSGVLNISAGSNIPMTETATIFQSTRLGKNNNQTIQYQAGYVDYDFFKTLDANILQGRVFSSDYSQDLTESVVINQSAVKNFGINNPVGKTIQLQDGTKRVIGVVSDFIVSGYCQTPALVYYLKPGDPTIGTIILRLKNGNINTTIKQLESQWNKYAPDAVFGFQFVDDELNKQYAKDIQFGKIIATLTWLAVCIASLGLFGLSLFMVKRRSKEISIRKIFGASLRRLIILQTKEIIYPVIIGSLVGYPIAYYLMNKWLQDFAYRIEISWWIFLLSGGIALVIALATVSFQAIKAATASPVDSLRYE
jgi:putative ABC transport system permease protein